MLTHLLTRLWTDTPFILEGALVALLRGADPQAAEHPYFKGMREKLKPAAEMFGNLSVIPVFGALAQRPDPFEQALGIVEDTGAIRALVDASAANEEVGGILLNVDSPGGFYTGGPELADSIKAASKRKPVMAWSGGTMASLAYLAASQATVVTASRSANVGSIGVYTTFWDVSKLFDAAGVKVELFKNAEGALKAIGLPGTSLSEEQRKHLQDRTQALFGEFRKTVLASRPGVPDSAMQGQTLSGQEAKRAGLIDGIGGMDYALGMLRSMVRKSQPN